jgi:hypothetical protein
MSIRHSCLSNNIVCGAYAFKEVAVTHTMSSSASASIYHSNTQNDLLLKSLMEFYQSPEHLQKMMRVINGETAISLRIVDWFVTNYSKKYYTVYELEQSDGNSHRLKVYNDYKLKLKAYSKKRFDPFCRWERIPVPYGEDAYVETTIGQLNFFKWAIENRILEYIETHHEDIERDMNTRNNSASRKPVANSGGSGGGVMFSDSKTRKKREELSISACKCIKKETVSIVVKFQ